MRWDSNWFGLQAVSIASSCGGGGSSEVLFVWGWPEDAQRSARGLETRGCGGAVSVKVWRGGITFVGAAPGAGALGIEGRCREVQGGAGRCVRGAPRRGRQDGAGGDAQYEMC